MTFRATIIAVAGARHYLVGLSDVKGNLVPLHSLKKVAFCQSLSKAKQLLRKNNIHTADLILQSAFDEMCGLALPAIAKQTFHI
jgi:chemotaxis signal transduction protein